MPEKIRTNFQFQTDTNAVACLESREESSAVSRAARGHFRCREIIQHDA